MGVDVNQHVAYYLGVMNVNDPLGGTPHDATMRYDARLALDIARRDVAHDATQCERDARRVAYDAAMRDMPIGLALRTMRVPTSPTSGRVFAPKAPVAHKETRLERGPNAWESQGDHARAHLRPDRGCHHPLVRCSHKW